MPAHIARHLARDVNPPPDGSEPGRGCWNSAGDFLKAKGLIRPRRALCIYVQRSAQQRPPVQRHTRALQNCGAADDGTIHL